MLTRTIALFAFGMAAVLVGADYLDAQPGKGKGPGKGPGPGAGSDIQKLERDLERLLEQVQATKAKLAKAKEAAGPKKGDFEGKKGFGKGFGGKGFGGKGKGFKGFDKKFESMKKFGKGGEAGAKLDPATIREKYEYYKKLHDALPKEKGKGFERPKGFEKKGPPPFERKGPPKGFEKKGPPPESKGEPRGGDGSLESRIDRLIRELEALRNEVRGGKKK